MFRIVFDPLTSRFVVQLSSLWGLMWRACINPIDQKSHAFITYKEACEWVKSIGLHEAYQMQSSQKDRAALYSPQQARYSHEL